MDADDGAVAVAVAEPAVRRHRRADPFRPLALVEPVETPEPLPWPPRGIWSPLLSNPAQATAADLRLLEDTTAEAYEKTRAARWRLERAQGGGASAQVLADFREAIAEADQLYDDLLSSLIYAARVVQGDVLTRERVEAIFDGRESGEPVGDVTEPTVRRDPDPFRRLRAEREETGSKPKDRRRPARKEREALLDRIKTTPAWLSLSSPARHCLAQDLSRHGPLMFASHETLAREIGCHRDTVRRARRELVAKGILLVEHRAENRWQTSNRYTINPKIFDA
jgi:Helix-turn-helix domain